jgi:hypothetical protein
VNTTYTNVLSKCNDKEIIEAVKNVIIQAMSKEDSQQEKMIMEIISFIQLWTEKQCVGH